jgi:hypothetical protein
VPDLIATAKINAKVSEDRISKIRKQLDGSTGSAAQIEELRVATVALETTAVDTFSRFESLMQNHFKRGPFSRKLKSMLVAAEEFDLADRIYQYYLAINVLKHGKGASYRELLSEPSSIIVVKLPEENTADETQTPTGLIDVTVPGFFDGMTAAILDAHRFLNKK